MSNSAPPSGLKKPPASSADEAPTTTPSVRTKKQSPLLLWIGLCCVVSAFFNFINAHWFHKSSSQQHHRTIIDKKPSIFRRGGLKAAATHGGGAMHMAMHEFMKGKEGLRQKKQKVTLGNDHEDLSVARQENHVEPQHDSPERAFLQQHETAHWDVAARNTRDWGDAEHPDILATLSCEAHGGPDTAAAQEMVYWHDIPTDTKYQSPLFRQDGVERYLTFEPDGGGWNNIRMAMETVIGLAIAMGRTLVLPPAQRMYLLAKDRGKQNTDFDFDHFFPIYDMARENEGLNVITMEEFLAQVAMTGQMRNKKTKNVEFPPGNRTDWNGQDVKVLKEWLRNVTHTPLWSPGSCLAAFPQDATEAAVNRLHGYLQTARDTKLNSPTLEHPPPVDSPPEERLRENLAGRKELCIYDTEMQREPVLHFMCYHKMRVRYLVHFYAFLFFEDYREDLWMKRFMRDHIRYKDPIQCAAARIVAALRKEFGDFDTFHIRRGDFQFKRTRIEAQQIYDNVKDVLTDGRPLFIATDERNKGFFDPLKKHYKVRFLDDYKHLLEGVNTNFYGMIDQLVASKGEMFFGCWHSTFTGFIARMRGYHSVNHKSPGHEEGRLPTTYYYVPQDNRDAMHKYVALHGAFFNREFPTSWRDIDASIGNIPRSA